MKDIYASIYRSQAYKDLLWQVEKIQRQAKADLDNVELVQELAKARQQLKEFTRDAVKLAEDLEKIPLNTNQLRLAKQYFNTGNYQLTQTVLADNTLLHEQEPLNEQSPVDCPVEQNVPASIEETFTTEPVSHNLTDTLAQTCQSFEQTLKYMGRIPEILFDYAHFLQENNQYPAAERLYREALFRYREQAVNNPTFYLPSIAVTLNNLAYLIQTTVARRHEVESLYQEALANYRKLAAVRPNVYQPHVANTLWGLAEAHLYWQEPQQAIELLNDAASIIEPYAKMYPPIFAVKQAAILNTLKHAKAAIEAVN